MINDHESRLKVKLDIFLIVRVFQSGSEREHKFALFSLVMCVRVCACV